MAPEHSRLAQLPDEMFTLIKSAAQRLGPRLGKLSMPKRKLIETPNYLASTSRGIVPHLSQDNFNRETSISGVYIALEDFIERAPHQVPPLYTFLPPDGSSPLRSFITLPEKTLLVLGPRRTPPVAAPPANGNTSGSITVSTAVGFRSLQAEEYAKHSEQVRPDIVVGMGDIPYQRALGSKRMEKATDRTIQWMQDHVAHRSLDIGASATPENMPKLFAPLLPLMCADQQYYIDYLTQEIASDVSGLSFYNLAPLEDLPHQLHHLPRLSFTEPSTPHHVLQQVALGLDILTLPFIAAATDAGIALDFTFPAARPTASDPETRAILPLGIDLWNPTHATDLSSLRKDCKCYACTAHHRAYVQHLLNAKEMLGWVLLQIHNHHTIDLFFSGLRRTIANGTFDANVEHFARVYEPELPERTGQGPRVRGYQQRSLGRGEPKINEKPYITLNEGEMANAETPTVPSSSADASDLEGQGFAESTK